MRNFKAFTCLCLVYLGFASGSLAHAASGKILVVVSSKNRLPLKNGAFFPTGYYLNELSVPAKRLMDEGYTLVFADPEGNVPSMDVTSDSVKYFGGDQKEYSEIRDFHQSVLVPQLARALPLKAVISGGLDQYDGLFIPGGHAPMIDLMANRDLGTILRYFHHAGKPTALICHGPISLLAAVSDPEGYQNAMVRGVADQAAAIARDWIYAGYKMTIFSSAEERLAAPKLGGDTLFFPEDAMRTAGALVSVAPPWQSNVIIDRELLTGQNPFSDHDLATKLVEVLNQNKCKESLQ